MKIILVTPAVPHPFGDTAARWYYVLITELLVRGHEVEVLTATEEAASRVAETEQWLGQHRGKLKMSFHRLKIDNLTVRRKWQSFLRPGSELIQDAEFAGQLRRALQKGYDVLHLEQTATGWMGLNTPRALLNVHYFDVIDWAARVKPSLGERKAFLQAQRATRRLLQSIPNIRLLTQRLRETAQSIYPKGNYEVVPLALDTSLYPLQSLTDEPVVGLIGSMHWEPSRSAAERLITRIWPLIKQRQPQAKLHIAGWNAAKYLGRHLPQTDVTLTENLAHPSEFFSKTAVMVYAPSRGSGMKVKVMESMAYGVPVVTTWEGVEGIEHENGNHCHVSETDAELANSACRLLENHQEREQMRMAARALIDDKYSPRPVVDKMENLYERLVSSGLAQRQTSLCT